MEYEVGVSTIRIDDPDLALPGMNIRTPRGDELVVGWWNQAFKYRIATLKLINYTPPGDLEPLTEGWYEYAIWNQTDEDKSTFVLVREGELGQLLSEGGW